MTMPELPEDLVEDILCRVPARNLVRLRLTCKRWNRLFSNRRFTTQHYSKAPKEFMFPILSQDGLGSLRVNFHGSIPSLIVKSDLSLFDPLYNNSYEFHIDGVFHCDGLLLCTFYKDQSRMVVWNPCTGQTKWINTINRNKKDRSFVLGYNQDNKSCVKSYKILSICRDGSEDSEIYEFSSDSWRILDHCRRGVAFNSHLVSLKGNAYWVALDEAKCQYLVSFNFSTEKSEPVPLPYECPGYRICCFEVVREEKLSVLLQRNRTSKTEVWVTNKIGDMKAVSWSKVLALDSMPDFHHILDRFFLDEEKRVVMRWETMLFQFDMIYIVGEDNKVTEVGFEEGLSYYCAVILISYVPSLVQIEQAKGKRKRSD